MAYRVLLTLLVLTLAACTGGRRGGGVIVPDASSDGGTDTGTPVDSGDDGTIILMDTGTMPECDPATNPCPVGETCVGGMCQPSTMPECTTSSMCPAGEICNASGVCVPDSTRTCEGSEIPYNRGAFCSSSTQTCVSACADNTCVFDCLDADPNPDCSACVNQNILSCINDAGCQTTWDPYVCCVEDNCGTMATSSCIMSVQTGACASTYGAWDSCTMTADIDTVCPMGSFLSDCF